MTPLHIDILLHYHCCPDDYRGGDFSAPAVREAIAAFVQLGLLVETHVDPRYQPTKGVHIYVEALCRVPLPERRWVMPAPHTE